MVVLDSTMLMLVFRPDVPGRKVDSSGKSIDHVADRIEHLVNTLEKSKTQIIIPTPVLSEILVRADPDESQKIIEEINALAVFHVVPFDTLATIELAVMTRNALAGGDKKAGSKEPWAKVKFDRQIVAIARVARARAIYTDDENLISTARLLNIPTVGLADLPLSPKSAQGQLPLEIRESDAIDEIAKQAETLEEPEGPEDAPAERG